MSHLPANVLRNLSSPEYVGRAVVRLAADPKISEKSGRVLEVGALAKEYGFTDIDGRSVDYHEEISGRRPPGWPPS
jgi:hypothetical protein